MKKKIALFLLSLIVFVSTLCPIFAVGFAEEPNASPVLPVVSFPPSERITCSLCEGTRRSICISCDGSGKTLGEIHDVDMYADVGLGGLADALNNLPCVMCNGTGEADCGFGYCDGTMVNPEYRRYCLGLKALSDEMNVRIFELESNQISPYISLDFCTMCDGLGWIPQLKLHDTHVPLCEKCYAQGMKLEFVDSFTQEELTRSYDNYLAYHPTTEFSGSEDDAWVEAGEEAIWVPSGMRDGRGAIDLGAESTGNCPGCGAKVYTSDAYCAFCR